MGKSESYLEQVETELLSIWKGEYSAYYRGVMGEEHDDHCDYLGRKRELLTDRTLYRRVCEDRSGAKPPRSLKLDALYHLTREALVEQDDDIVALRQELENSFFKARFEFGGERLSRAALLEAMATADSREEREAAYALLGDFARGLLPTVTKLIQARKAKARELLSEDFAGVLLGPVGMGPDELEALLREALGHSRALTEKLREACCRGLGIAEPRPWDLDYHLRRLQREVTPDLDLDLDGVRAAVEQILSEYGLSLADYDITIEEYPGPYRGLCLPIGVWEDIRVLIFPSSAIHTLHTTFHELAHALHFAFQKGKPFLVAAGTAKGDAHLLTEIDAYLLQAVVCEGRFLSGVLGLEEDQGEGLQAARGWVELASSVGSMTSSLFELSLYRSDDLSPTAVTGMARESLSMGVFPDYPFTFQPVGSPFLVTYPCYVQSYAIAGLSSSQIIGKFRQDRVDRALTDRSFYRTLLRPLWDCGFGENWRRELGRVGGFPFLASQYADHFSRCI